ncbi:YwnF family protein [Bacillus amyloliquefaciens]|uniref:YwnF family protein n=1 Tax=Bacillus amyloliquefaciens TaxID=1390 RepID=UPI00214FFBD9|nr:YwnF family protein [Bacillus amyloliquefaciens]MCR4371903.1 YwnF family protein [Bacillus amyloliquefaciens]
MKLEHAEQLPGFIKKEIQKIQIAIAPLMKKSIIYRFLAFPLAAFSLFHLASLLIQAPSGRGALVSAGIFALLAALGLAFFKEAGYQRKQVQKTIRLYMLNRIRKSDILSEERKSAYTRLIAEEPSSMKSFIEFLTEEDRKKEMLY